MKSHLTTLCIISLLTACLLACQKKEELPLIDIPAGIIGAVPYQDGQVVKYRDSGGVVHTCIVKKEDGEKEIGDHRVRAINWSMNKDGDEHQEMAGVNISSIYNGSIHVTVLQQAYPGGNGSTYRIFQNLRITDDGQFITDTTCISHPTLVINGITEQDVMEVKGGGPKLFYNKQKGILRWELESGQHYTRVD